MRSTWHRCKHTRTHIHVHVIQRDPIDRDQRVSIADGRHNKGIMWESIKAFGEFRRDESAQNLTARDLATQSLPCHNIDLEIITQTA